MDKCCICNKEKKDNIKILGKAICADCEWKILTEKTHILLGLLILMLYNQPTIPERSILCTKNF